MNARRVARELALKTLFQVDVGKQPLAEVLAGANEQAQAPLVGPANQVVIEAQRELRSLAARRVEELGHEISTQSARQIKTAATQIAGEVRAYAEQIAEIAADLASAPERALPDAEGRIDNAAEQTRHNIGRFAARASAVPQALEALAGAAEPRIEQIANTAKKNLSIVAEIAGFMHALVHGVLERTPDIDERLTGLSKDWGLERQAAVDRNILRLAAFEILYLPDVPAGATINEAVELAKRYSTAESGRFVNGVLGALVSAKAA